MRLQQNRDSSQSNSREEEYQSSSSLNTSNQLPSQTYSAESLTFNPPSPVNSNSVLRTNEETGNVPIDPDDGQLDPIDLARRIEQFRMDKKISRDALARSILGISGITLGFLLRNTEPWDLMSNVNKYRLKKLHDWYIKFDEKRAEDRALMFTSKWAGKYHTHKEEDYDQKLDTKELSERITNLLRAYRIHMGFFANRKLFVNKLYFKRLITSQLSWKHLTFDDRRVFRKIKTWADATPEQLIELKRQNDIENKRRAEFFKKGKKPKSAE